MLSLFAYGLTWGQAQANPSFTDPNSSNFRRPPKNFDNSDNQPNCDGTNSLKQISELQQTYALERRLFF